MVYLKNLLFVLLLFNCVSVYAQNNDCGTNPTTRIYPDTTLSRQMRTTATYPLLIKVFVHVVADDDASDLAAGDSSIMRQMKNMRDFYAPHGICFIIAGYEQINSSSLNILYASEENDLLPFVRSNKINVFFHKELYAGWQEYLNGNTYNIPNHYLSVVGSAAKSLTNRSTLAHEMGHCFGLYHTFQARTDNGSTLRENVARSGTCKNCITEGDLLCDTDADREIDENLIGSISCSYSGSMQDACNTTLLMTPTNIMTYGRRSCRNVFTTAQGNRAQDFILSDFANYIAPDAISLSTNQTFTSGAREYLARNSVTITATDFRLTGTTTTNFNAPQIVIPPGTLFSPGQGGYTAVRANGLCQ